ncbi:MAG: DUF1840 family protein [Burkholderiaceae bacterium]
MIRFLSKAAASFVMTDPVASQVFQALGEELQIPGIWPVERLPVISQKLAEALVAAKEQDARAERALHEAREKAAAAGETDDLLPRELPVGLSRRLVPVLHMVKRAQADSEPVVWERA